MKSFIISTLISFLLMFGLTYVAIDTFGHFYPNINRAYMAGIMSAPMIIVKAITMKARLKKRAFWGFISTGVVLTIAFFLAIRTQFGVGDRAFLRSMIPHHSSAIVMCEHSNITDQEIIQLCQEIIKTQKTEIKIMQEILNSKDFSVR